MSSDVNDEPVARKRAKRTVRKRTAVVFSSDDEADTSGSEYQVPDPKRSALEESDDTDDLDIPRSVKPATPGVRINKSFRTTSRSTSIISGIEQINDNNDEEERKARRRSRLLELHQRSMNSPGAKTGERLAKATPLSNMSEAAIAEHYGNCIKLAAENKINAKNAFSLHLIDYMNDLLKHDQLENFQVASSSLDAGAKIYAGRVDAVHQETFKVLGGLGRSKTETGDGEQDEEAPEGSGSEELQQRQSRKPAQRRKKNVIQKNLSKIRIKSVEFKTDVDPLFQHQAVAYDEGGSAELRLNNVFSRDNTCELILDSDIQIMGTSTRSRNVNDQGNMNLDRAEAEQAIRSTIGDRLEWKEPSEAGIELCPAFADFTFTEWNADDNPERRELSLLDEHAYDPNGDVEPMPMSGDISDVDVVPPDDNSVVSGDAPNPDTSIYIGESKEAMLVQSAVDGMMQSSNTFVDSLRMMLTEQLNNRGQLHDNLLGMWAGPDHWRSKAKTLFPAARPVLQSRRLSCSGVDNATDPTEGEVQSASSMTSRRAKNRLGREKGYIALDEILLGEETCRQMEDELKKVFRRGRAAISLSDQCVDRSMKRNYLLPPVVDYEKQAIIQLMNKKVLVLTRTESSLENGEVSDYNFNNARDAKNYCPPVEGNPEPVGDMIEPADDDIVDDLPPCGEDYGGGDEDVEPFAGAFTQVLPGDTQSGQLELVSQPRKIAKIEIGYAKAAKRINVRFIKSLMWDFLSDKKDPVIASSSIEDNETSQTVDIESPKQFSEMLTIVPQKVNKQVASDLSVPILLNCLLHLANEKCLQIENNDVFTELIITQASQPPRFRDRASNLLKRNTAQARLDEWMETDLHDTS